MPRLPYRLLVGSFLLLAALPLAAPRAADSPASGVPKGEVTRYTFEQSKIFPGTTRDYWVYVPKQYDPAKPACVYVNQDGIQFDAPAVFDRLIHNKEMPVVIGVFVRPGRVKATSKQALDRFNRSYEYDGLGPDYARFLLEELLPEVEKKTAPDGRPIHLSHDPNDRCVAGASSGAVCSFTAAWERPDSFRRVFSSIGTYVGLRGANVYPILIRKVEPKPLRVFLQDGSADGNAFGGDWWMANQEMERSLTFAGYEVNHAWGTGGHDGKHATEIFPDAMRWLWKDWPAPVKAGNGSQQLQEIVVPGEGWTPVAEGYQYTEGPTVNARGEVFFTDSHAGKAYKIDLDGKVSLFLADTKKAVGQAFGPDGRLYAAAEGTDQILAYDAGGKPAVVAEGFRGNDLVVAHGGGLYVTNPGPEGTSQSKVWYVSPQGGEKGCRHRAETRQRHRTDTGSVAAVRRRHPDALGLLLPYPARRVAGGQAKVHPPARARHLGRKRCGRHARGPRRPGVGGDAHGHPGERPDGAGAVHPADAEPQGRPPLLRRRGLRHVVCPVRGPGV